MNLLNLVKDQLSDAVVGKISDYIGESSSATNSALGGAMPAILGGIMQKASTTQGAGEIMNLIKNGNDGGLLDNLVGMLSGNNSSSLLSKGGSLLSTIFGNKLGGLTDVISNISGIKSSSASSLLSIAAPILMNVLGKQVSSQGLGVSGLASLLMNQKDSVKNALPAGMGSILNISSLGDFLGNAKNDANEIIEDVKGGFNWLPWLLGLLLLGGALFYWKSCRNTVASAVDKVDSTATKMVDAVDSSATSIANSIKKKLSTGVELTFGEKSIENELIGFIEDQSKVVDKTTWFNFRDLRFATGSAEIDSTSMQEVKSISEILKAYPNVNIKVGGYTDNVGKEAANQKLSAARAANVVKALVSTGIDASRLESEGYGSQHPVASNDTEEGRAQNRRIAVRVTKK